MKTFCMCIPVRDQLCRSDRSLEALWKDSIKVGGKTLSTAWEIRNFFVGQLAKGHEVVPAGECDNFDYKKGCQGHKEVKV